MSVQGPVKGAQTIGATSTSTPGPASPTEPARKLTFSSLADMHKGRLKTLTPPLDRDPDVPSPPCSPKTRASIGK